MWAMVEAVANLASHELLQHIARGHPLLWFRAIPFGHLRQIISAPSLSQLILPSSSQEWLLWKGGL